MKGVKGLFKAYNSQICRLIGATMAIARDIAYQYSDNGLSDDLEIDLTFTKRDIILRRGRNWKIDSVHSEHYITDLRMVTIWVYLVDVLVN
jgi:hypothetical protein